MPRYLLLTITLILIIVLCELTTLIIISNSVVTSAPIHQLSSDRIRINKAICKDCNEAMNNILYLNGFKTVKTVSLYKQPYRKILDEIRKLNPALEGYNLHRARLMELQAYSEYGVLLQSKRNANECLVIKMYKTSIYAAAIRSEKINISFTENTIMLNISGHPSKKRETIIFDYAAVATNPNQLGSQRYSETRQQCFKRNWYNISRHLTCLDSKRDWNYQLAIATIFIAYL